MMKQWLRIWVGILVLAMAFGLAACGGGTSPEDSGQTPPESSQPSGGPTLPVSENFDFGAALADEEGWEGITAVNPVLDSENGFLTFREKSNSAIGYVTKGMSAGEIGLKLRVSISTDTTAYIGFSNQSADLSAFCYEPGGRMYTVEFSNNSRMYVKKWVNEKETVLSGSKAEASVPLSLASQFTEIRITVTEGSGKVGITVRSGNTVLLDVSDSSDPILGGGAVTVSYMGTGGMALGGIDSDVSAYRAPESLGLTIYDSPDVAVASGSVDLLADFAQTWTGRERIFSHTAADGRVTFESKDNPEEPQDGVTEFQAVYTDKIFGNAQFEYEFRVISHGEWLMFWFRCVPEETPNVSIWGNKLTREMTNGYSMLVTVDGYVQIHKWSDGAQIWLNGQGTREWNRNKLMAEQVRELFGEIPDDPETFSMASQISQAEALKFFIERTRLKKWEKTGIIWWNLLDCWPQFSDAVVDYYFKKKLAFEYICAVQHPLCLMLKEPENWHLTAVVGNDGARDFRGRFRITDAESGRCLKEGDFFAPANQNTAVAEIRVCRAETAFYLLELETGEGRFVNHYVQHPGRLDLQRYLRFLELRRKFSGKDLPSGQI